MYIFSTYEFLNSYKKMCKNFTKMKIHNNLFVVKLNYAIIL